MSHEGSAVSGILLLLAEFTLLAAAQVFGGPPWTVLAAVAIVLESAAGLRLAGLLRLSGAFVWLAAFVVTGNRELFFCFAMTLAAHATMQFVTRSWQAGGLAGGLVVAAFLGFRVAQQATARVLAVEALVALAILAASLLAHGLLARSSAATTTDADEATARAALIRGDTAIVAAAAVASYCGLAF